MCDFHINYQISGFVFLYAWAVLKGYEMRKIYLIEDDSTLRRELVRILSIENSCEVYAFVPRENFKGATPDAIAHEADIYIIDLKLPGNDGISICKQVKANLPKAKILVLTSSDSEIDEIMSMHIGVDDYLVKPYNPPVLIAHIERLFKQLEDRKNDETIRCKGMEVNLAKSSVSYCGKVAELSRNEMRILWTLARADGAIVSRQDLMFELWQSDRFIDDNTLTVNINRLRKTLSSISCDEDFLKTHRRQGYSI